MEEEEVLDWGDDLRQNEEDGEDVVSLAGSEEEASRQKQDVPVSAGAPSAARAAATTKPPSRFSALPKAEVRGDNPSLPVPKPAKSPTRVGPSTSLISIASVASTQAGTTVATSGISASSHPFLPPKPSEEITLAAEAASREARKRDRDAILAAAPLRRALTPPPVEMLPPGWIIRESRSTGEEFYHHPESGTSSWTKPELPLIRPRGRSATPPRRSDDDRERDDRYRDVDSRYDRDGRRDADRDKARSRNSGRRRRSGSPNHDHDIYRPYDPDRWQTETVFNGWDRWRPEDDEDDLTSKPSNGRNRDARSGHSASLKGPTSLPSRPDASHERPRPSSRRASSREPVPGHDTDNIRPRTAKSSRTNDNHWSPSRGFSNSPPPHSSIKRDVDARDADYASPHEDDKSYRERVSAQLSNQPPAPRKPAYGRSRSRSPQRARSTEARSSRRRHSPSLRQRSTSPHRGRTRTPPYHRSPPPDESSPPRDSNYERRSRDAHASEARGESKRRLEGGSEYDNGWASRRVDTQSEPLLEADQHRHKRAPLPPQNEEFKQNSSTFVPPLTSFAGAYPQPPTKPKGRGVPLLPVKENPGVVGAPSGPRADRPAIPPGTKDASHPDFASQVRPPPSGPSKKDPYLSSTRGPSSYRPSPQSPPLLPQTPSQQRATLSNSAPNGNVAVQLALAPDVPNDQIQHERMLEERARASQRGKRVISQSPPPAKRTRGAGSNHGFSKPRNMTGPNSVPVSNARQFGKRVDEDQASDDAMVNNSIQPRPSLRDRMEVDETSRPNMYQSRGRQGSLLTVPQKQHPSLNESMTNPQSVESSLSHVQGNSPAYSASSQGGPSLKTFSGRVRDRDYDYDDEGQHRIDRRGPENRGPNGRDQDSYAHSGHDSEVQNTGSLLRRMKLPETNVASPKVRLRDRITESPEVVKDSPQDDDDDGQGDEANDGPSGTQGGRRRGGGRRKGGRGSRRSRR